MFSHLFLLMMLIVIYTGLVKVRYDNTIIIDWNNGDNDNVDRLIQNIFLTSCPVPTFSPKRIIINLKEWNHNNVSPQRKHR